MGDVDGSTTECGSLEELKTIDINLASLCQHIQMDAWNSGAFSDMTIECMGSTFKLHKLILSRSSYFRHMLQGPWKEASASVVTLKIDDENVNKEAIDMALSYLYGIYPKLNENNAFRVLAAASFLDLQDLCSLCTDFITAEIWSSNILVYQAFAEKQDYGIHGDKVRKACWGYLCRGGAVELEEILPKLSTQTLCALLTSDELWVPNEEKRFELALNVFLAKGCLLEANHSHLSSSTSWECCHKADMICGNNGYEQKEVLNEKSQHISETHDVSKGTCLQRRSENHHMANEVLVELADSVVDGDCPARFESALTYGDNGGRHSYSAGTTNTHKSQNFHLPRTEMEADLCCHHLGLRRELEASGTKGNNSSFGEAGSNDCKDKSSKDQTPHSSSSRSTSTTRVFSDGWGRCGYHVPSWGGRIVSRKELKACLRETEYYGNEEVDALLSVFESGGILYCHMSFEVLLDARKQLEELSFSCKSVYDGLWLQMLLKHQILAISLETCTSCCLSRQSCHCRQNYNVFPHGRANDNFYRDNQQMINSAGSIGAMYAAEASVASSSSVPSRVRVRTSDGLAGIGRGQSIASEDVTWPPTRVVFSRVPYGFGSRNSQRSLANEQSEGRLDTGEVEYQRDGLTVAVGLIQGFGNGNPTHSDQTPRTGEHPHSEMGRKFRGTGPSWSGNVSMQQVESEEQVGQEREMTKDSPITLDLQTPLRAFPPFRFGMEFEDVHRLGDGQAKHSPEIFYAGSLWKLSVQAFNDEDPQGRRTLGLFLHRRRAEYSDTQQKVHLYVDRREKVTVRYQLICPSKRDVMVFGSLDQAGTLLPKAPKGWGWRTALFFDDLPDILQRGSLRVAAVIQVV